MTNSKLTPVKAFKACAENGTHYLDVTGEIPFVAKMIKKYEHVAKQSGSMMFPEIGIESAPADLVAWSLAKQNRIEFGAKTAETIISVHKIKWVTMKPTCFGASADTVVALHPLGALWLPRSASSITSPSRRHQSA